MRGCWDDIPLAPAVASESRRRPKLESAEPQEIKVLLVDDHPLVRRALRDVLEREPDLRVIGEAGNGQQAIDMTEQFRPDVVIMDISMPVLNGVEATKLIKASSPLTAVLILTVHTDVETIFSILQAGASGYLVKSVFGPEVIHTIRAVMDGDTVLSQEVSHEVIKYALERVPRAVRQVPQERISAKEMEILSLAAKGMSNKQIGTALGIAETTVKSYFVDLFQKLNVRSRTEAVFVSLKSGILTLDDLG
jgi:NarL family two-component system response regulator LiaR